MKSFVACACALLLLAGCGGSGGDPSDSPQEGPTPDTPLTQSQPSNENSPGGDDMSIQDGSTVTMHFTMSSGDEVLQSSKGGEPLTYVQGQEQMFPAVEAALVGLSAGDTKEITLEPADAFGEVNPEAVQEVPKAGFQDPGTLEVGSPVQGQVQGQPFTAIVTAIGAETVTLDLNHPLAGKTLKFDVEVVSVQ